MAENKYAAPHVWNLVSKQIRENYPEVISHSTAAEMHDGNIARRAIESVALGFARRFVEDEGFNPIQFLENCSPNRDLYPLQELWGKGK